ncbi:MAG: c-type cytochrome biogenesis protein CcmI [Cocleimonas sp.]
MFWIISAILTLIALAFVFPTLIRKNNNVQDGRREQNIFIANEQLKELETRFKQGEIESDDYQTSRDEIEESLFSDVSDGDVKAKPAKGSLLSAGLIALLIPAIAIPVYSLVGNPAFTKSFDSKQVVKTRSNNNVPKNADGTPDIDTMIAGLQKKMEADPDNAKGWFMLGRSYMVVKRYPQAAKSYDKALKLKPESADIMLSLADSLAMTNNGEITGRPVELVNKALEIEPNNLTALWLGGMAARQQGEYLIAIERWKKVLLQIKDPQETQEVNSLITEAMTKLTPEQKKSLGAVTATIKPPISVQGEQHPFKTDQAKAAGISVTVSLSPEMKEKVKPTDIVFVYAKALSGPPMPLAAAKKQVKDLPFEVFLDDSMAMMPTMKLSAFPEVVVGARISLSGQPIAQNGDLFTDKKPVKAGDKISLEINTVFSK